MSDNRKIIKGASLVGAFTALSRIFGLLRDMVIARYFGASPATDAFFVAFRIPNTLRRLFAEGALTISFIPVFKEALVKEGKSEAKKISHVTFTFLSLTVVTVVLISIIFAPFIVKLIAPGFKDEKTLELTVFLTRLIFPYLFFICLVALAMAVLNSLGKFAAPAAAPVLLNIALILSAVMAGPFFEEPVTALAIGVLMGGLAQVLLQIPFIKKEGYFPEIDFNFSHPSLKRILLLIVPALFGVAVYQLNVFITTTVLASYLPEGSISYLYYADRFFQLPLGIFVISMATAILPTLSEQAASERLDDMRKSITFSFKVITFITLPAAAGLYAVSIPVFSLFFQGGKFDYETTLKTADALRYYALGIWAVGGIKVVAPAFYAMKDMKTPVWAAFISLIANIFFSIILMGPLLHGGLALATTLSSMINLIILIAIIGRRLGKVIDLSVISSFVKSALASLFTWYAAACICRFGNWEVDGINLEKAFVLGAAIGAGMITYTLFSYIFRSEEVGYLLKTLKERRGRKSGTPSL
ncbi:MAG: murein biosynthesis integral membrane protein MurJ [Deltaproteobacteria bacterium]|nr:murein biosynthesis integral membrane protein MurJ [Deltaproteobacteria bacterium]